jgi:hypothetical protein
LVFGAPAGDLGGIAVDGSHRLSAYLENDAPWLATVPELAEGASVRPGGSPGGVYLNTVAIGPTDFGGAGQDVYETVHRPGTVVDEVEAPRVVRKDAGYGVRGWAPAGGVTDVTRQ